LVYQYAGDRSVVNYAFPLRLFHYVNTAMLDCSIYDRAGQEALKDVYGTAVDLDPELETDSLLGNKRLLDEASRLHAVEESRGERFNPVPQVPEVQGKISTPPAHSNLQDDDNEPVPQHPRHD